jgi:hypothetical protein
VRFRLLPLLFRKVEIEAAQVNGAGIAMYEREKPPGEGTKKEAKPSFALHLPKLEFHRVDVRSRDRYGSGYDVRGLSGSVDIDGNLDALRSAKVEAKGDSLSWKPSAQGKAVPLPGPLHLIATLESRDQGKRYEFTQGHIEVGALTSELSGSLNKPAEDGGAMPLALVITGKPQSLKSSDEAFRALMPASPGDDAPRPGARPRPGRSTSAAPARRWSRTARRISVRSRSRPDPTGSPSIASRCAMRRPRTRSSR